MHRARRLALQGLCCLDAQGSGVMDLVELFLTDSREPAQTIEISRQMLKGTFSSLTKCDDVLGRHTRDWNLRRLAMVDRNILRLAVWEFIWRNTPPKVVIVEAIRLAREFSTAESPRFINGVLDAAVKELAHQARDEAEQDDQEGLVAQ